MPPTGDESYVVVTRRRLAYYFLAAAAAATPVSVAAVAYTGRWGFAVMPLAPFPIWLFLCYHIPREGTRLRTIRGTPGTVQLLAWLLLMSLIGLGLSLVGSQVFGQGWHAPPRWYHWLAALVWVVLTGEGSWLIAQKYRGPRQNQ
jgi:hypothetical protein